MENDYRSLTHSRWDCKSPVVFVPNWRRRQLGAIFHALARQKECQIIGSAISVMLYPEPATQKP